MKNSGKVTRGTKGINVHGEVAYVCNKSSYIYGVGFIIT